MGQQHSEESAAHKLPKAPRLPSKHVVVLDAIRDGKTARFASSAQKAMHVNAVALDGRLEQ
eukprot:4789459-Amphidinium_carterae.1